MPDNTFGDIVRLTPNASAPGELYAAVIADPCPDCGAAAGEHCLRSAVGTLHSTRYETRLAHEPRINAAAAKRAQKAADDAR